MHEVLVNRSGGLSLPRKSVVRLTDRPDMTLDVYHGRKTTMLQQQQQGICLPSFPYTYLQNGNSKFQFLRMNIDMPSNNRTGIYQPCCICQITLYLQCYKAVMHKCCICQITLYLQCYEVVMHKCCICQITLYLQCYKVVMHKCCICQITLYLQCYEVVMTISLLQRFSVRYM